MYTCRHLILAISRPASRIAYPCSSGTLKPDGILFMHQLASISPAGRVSHRFSAAVSDSGPCIVLPDSKSTVNNPWAWNKNVNMLYIDQPVSTGFSYTDKINSTLNLLFLGSPVAQTGITPFEAYSNSVLAQNTTFLYGTLSEQNPLKTANSTLTAAKTLWHFSQAWFSEFAGYRTHNRRVSIWGNSYVSVAGCVHYPRHLLTYTLCWSRAGIGRQLLLRIWCNKMSRSRMAR